MERVAIISDIHGNLEALQTVLHDIENRGIPTIYCLGDIIAKGAHAKECLTLVREKCQIIIQGNGDAFFSSDIDITKLNEKRKARVLWNKEQLSSFDQAFLANLPYCYEFYMSGSFIRLFHASPYQINGMISTLDTLEKKYAMFLPSKYTNDKIADVVIYGHTHAVYLDHLYHKTLINVGSVGNPIETIMNEQKNGKSMETTQATYVIVEGNYGSKIYDGSLSFQFVRIPYDIEKELNESGDMLEKEAYYEELKKGKYRDTDTLKDSLQKRNIDINQF